jgi:hypothetical protein
MKKFFSKYNDLLLAIFAWVLSIADFIYYLFTDSIISLTLFILMAYIGFRSFSDYRKEREVEKG